MSQTNHTSSHKATLLRKWGLAGLIILILLASGCLYLWIGSKEAFGARAFSFRMVGAVILLCALVILAAAFATGQFQRLALQNDRPRDNNSDQAPLRTSGHVAIVGIIASATLSAVLFVTQFATGDITKWIFVWALLTVASCVAFLYAIRAGMHPPGMGKVFSALSIGVLISVTSLAYNDFYLPSIASPFLSVSINIKKASIGKASKYATIPFTLTIRNSQKVGVYILAAYYDVAGRTNSESTLTSSTADAAAIHYQPIRQSISEDSYDLLSEGPIGISTAGSFLNPGEALTVSDTVMIPIPTSYDAVQISYDVVIMRDDRYQLEPNLIQGGIRSWNERGRNVETAPRWVLHGLPSTTHFLNWSAGIVDDNFLGSLLHEPRVVNVWYLLPPFHSRYTYTPDIAANISDIRVEYQAPTSQQAQAELNRYGFEASYGSYATATMAKLHVPSKQ